MGRQRWHDDLHPGHIFWIQLWSEDKNYHKDCELITQKRSWSMKVLLFTQWNIKTTSVNSKYRAEGCLNESVYTGIKLNVKFNIAQTTWLLNTVLEYHTGRSPSSPKTAMKLHEFIISDSQKEECMWFYLLRYAAMNFTKLIMQANVLRNRN